MRLFSYCIPVDDGAAPNPFGGTCTLAICKPVIRRKATIGDWVIGVGSKNVGGIDYSGKLVYAMEVTNKMRLKKYDDFCPTFLPEKIPDINSSDYKRKVGDCIYDFSKEGNDRLRLSVHSHDNIDTDLKGEYVLLSENFYYFGNNAIEIPDEFKLLILQGRGHQSVKNEPVKYEFIAWLEDNYTPNKIEGEPQLKVEFDMLGNRKLICSARCQAALEDETELYLEERLPLSHWNYFLALEADLKTLSRYVEIHEDNFGTFSISLTQLFLACCAEIEIVLRDICKIVSVKNRGNINDFYNIIKEKIPSLFSKEVHIPLYNLILKPFGNWEFEKSPEWWNAYNHIKHNRSVYYGDANLKNTINALGALYILIFELIRVFEGGIHATGFSVYSYLQPKQELYKLVDEQIHRDWTEGKHSLF